MVVVLPEKKKLRYSHKKTGVLPVDYETPVEPFIDVEAGDWVVHVLHGIARYRGVRALKNKDGRQDHHFELEFVGKEKLYVPTRDLHLLQRYTAFVKKKPQLSKLGSRNWQKLKERTRRGVFSFAGELLTLQAKRKLLKGFQFQKDTDWQRQLEREFPYEDTEDQKRSTAEVKADLESEVPMDRLLCGDVGYGKTEVALRAAFKG